MEFNVNLLKGIKEEDVKIAELVLFLLEREINPFYLFLEKQNGIYFKESFRDKLNEVTSTLHVNGAIDTSYGTSAYRVTEDLYNSKPITPEFVTRLRGVFKSNNIGLPGKSGNNQNILTVLQEWRKKYPEYNDSEILRAAESYVDFMLGKGEALYIRNLDNFILTETDSLLATWIEDSGTVVDNWRNKLT